MKTQQTRQTSGLWQDLKDLPGRYWVLFSGTLVNRFGHFVVPFLALYLRQVGHGTWVTGIVLAAYGAGALGAGAIGGYLADRVGRKATLVFSSFSAAVAMLLLSQARSVPALVVMTFATGMASAMYFPAASALLADMVPPHLRVRAFSCQRLAVNLGFAAGTATAGLVARHSFVALFMVDAATTAVLGLVVLFGLPAGVRIARERASWGPALRHVRCNPLFLRAVLASFCVGATWACSRWRGVRRR